MHRSLALDLAELAASYVPAGTAQLRIPRHLATRLVEEWDVDGTAMPVADDVERIEPTEWNGLTVTYMLDELLGPGHAEIDQTGRPGMIIALPSRLEG